VQGKKKEKQDALLGVQLYNSARTASVEGHCKKQEKRYKKNAHGKLCAKIEYNLQAAEYRSHVT
jgi:hypothetical protein